MVSRSGFPSLRSGASVHIIPNGNGVFLHTDQGDLIRAGLALEGYKELSRTRRGVALAKAADHLRKHHVLQRRQFRQQMMRLIDEAHLNAANAGAIDIAQL